MTGSKCSCLVLSGERVKNRKVMAGRNYDWLPSFADLDLVLSILHPADGSPAIASLNYAGCFYLTSGMNSNGVFLELNSGAFAATEYRAERFHNTWLLWTVLRQARDKKQALRLLNTFKSAGNYLIGIADPTGASVFEWAAAAPGAIINEENGLLAISNHFIQPNWQNLPQASQGGNFSSVARRNALMRLAGTLPQPAQIKELQQILSIDIDHGGAKWDGTLFQIIAIPADKHWLIRPKKSGKWINLPAIFSL